MTRASAVVETDVTVQFVLYHAGEFSLVREAQARPASDGDDRDTIERVAEHFVRQDLVLYDTDLHTLEPSQCFEAAMGDATHTVVLVKAEHWNDALTTGIIRQLAGMKRPASEDLGHRARPRKVQMVGERAAQYPLTQDNPWHEWPDDAHVDSGQ